jgi:hypothetical protein
VSLLIAPPIGGAPQPYLKSIEVFFCPSDFARAPYRKKQNLGTPPRQYLTWGPTNPGAFNVGGNSQSYWQWYFPRESWSGAKATPLPDLTINDRYSKKGAGNKMVLNDQGYLGKPGDAATMAIEWYTYPFFHGNTPQSKGWNCLYLDGHAKWVRIDEIRPTSNLTTFNTSAYVAFNNAG